MARARKLRIRVKGSQFIELEDLLKLEFNDLKADEGRDVTKLVDAIKEHGFITPFFIWKNKYVIDGKGREKALQTLVDEGWKIPPLPFVEIEAKNAEEAKKMVLLVSSQFGKVTQESFEAFTDGIDISSLAFELPAMTFGEIEVPGFAVDGVAEPEIKEIEPQIDRAEGLAKKWGTKAGQLWIIKGKQEHRLLCGDSTNKEDVERLMGGEQIGVLHADPPYGMSLNTKFDEMFTNDPRHRKTGGYDLVIGDDKPFDPSPFFGLCNDQFWWGADYYHHSLPAGGAWFCWDKRWNESGMKLDEVVGNCLELCWSMQTRKRRVFRRTWSGHHGLQGEDTKSRVHPNQKPSDLSCDLIRETSGLIFDPFLGSGTTILAAEQLNRRCFGLEISPKYCAVILERMTEAGCEARLEEK